MDCTVVQPPPTADEEATNVCFSMAKDDSLSPKTSWRTAVTTWTRTPSRNPIMKNDTGPQGKAVIHPIPGNSGINLCM